MKRTKEAYFRPNPTALQTTECSGLNYLPGEDVPFHCRKRDYQQLQKQFLDQQINEKKQIKQIKKLTDTQFDQQVLQTTHQRGLLQLEKASRLQAVEKAHDDFNLQASNERKLREKQQRQRQLQQQRRQLELLNQRKVKKWIPNRQ